MLPKTIQNLEDVEDKYQAFYSSSEDGYSIDANLQGPDITGLKATNADLKTEKSHIKTELETVRAELKKMQEQDTENKLLEQENYSELLLAKETSFNADLEHATSELLKMQRDAIQEKLISIAKEIAGDNAALLVPHLTGLEYDNGIKYPDGASLEDFITSIKENPMFEPLLKAQKASGGGAASTSSSNSHTALSQMEAYFDPNSKEYSPLKQSEVQASDPSVYESLSQKFHLDDPFARVRPPMRSQK